MAWVILLGAGLLEIVWATALKQSDGFSRLWPSVIGIGVSLVSFFMLAFALRDLPLGTAYVVWMGIGGVGVAVVGLIAFGDRPSPARLALISLILVGVAGLRIIEN